MAQIRIIVIGAGGGGGGVAEGDRWELHWEEKIKEHVDGLDWEEGKVREKPRNHFLNILPPFMQTPN